MVSLSKIRNISAGDIKRSINTDNARKVGSHVQRLGETAKRFNRSQLGEIASNVPYLGKGLSMTEKYAPKVGDMIIKGANKVDELKSDLKDNMSRP